MRSGGDRRAAHRQPVVSVEQLAAFSIEAGAVYDTLSGESYQKPLIGAPALVFKLAGSSSAPFRAGLDDLDDTPLFAGLTEPVHQSCGITEEPHTDQVLYRSTGRHPFEYIHTGLATGTHDVGSTDGHPDIGEFNEHSAFLTLHVQSITPLIA